MSVLSASFALKLSQRHEIWITPQLREKLKLQYKSDILLSFGLTKVHVTINDQLERKIPELLISSAANELLNIPLNFEYHVKVSNENELIIGPYIGVLVDETNYPSYAQKLRVYRLYSGHQRLIKGALVGFSYDDINWYDLTVYGTVYDPQSNIWVRKKMPLPRAVFNRSRYRGQKKLEL